MPIGRSKGKRIERWFVNNGLKDLFPDARRNAGTQAQSGGVDVENTPGFNFEIKGGKRYRMATIRQMIDQVKREGKFKNLDVVLVKPDREEAFAIIPYPDFLKIMKKYLEKK